MTKLDNGDMLQHDLVWNLDECDLFPLSFAQERLWILWRLEPESPRYNVPVAIATEGELDLERVRETLAYLADRHETLRTRFTLVDEVPMQVIVPEWPPTLDITDLSNQQITDRETTISDWANSEAKRPFDLEKGPLWRTHVLRFAPNSHVVLFNMHHILSDGWSMGVLTREFATSYLALCAGEEPQLPELELQYADFAQSQREWMEDDGLKAQRTYWHTHLQDAPPRIDLVADHPDLGTNTGAGATYHFTLPPALTTDLRTLSRKHGASLFMTLLAIYRVLLVRTTGQRDLPLGIAIANRNQAELENLIGFFVNSLVLREQIEGNPRFSDFLQTVRDTTLEGFANQDYPFNLLVKELEPDRQGVHNPLFNVMFALQNAPGEALQLPGLRLKKLSLFHERAKFDQFLEFFEMPDGSLQGNWEYNTDLFAETSIHRLAQTFSFLAYGFASNKDLPILTCATMTATERQALLAQPPAVPYARTGDLVQVFESVVSRAPQRIAVRCENETLTYEALHTAACRLAQHLPEMQGRGVAVCLDRSPQMIVAILAILRAGGYYVGFEAKWPAGRIATIMDDAQLTHAITSEDWKGELPTGITTLDITLAESGDTNHQRAKLHALDLAYVSYTSGSTGKPKGVCVPHRAVLRLVQGVDYVHLDQDEVLLQFASLAFDASTLEIWGALLAGATLVQAPRDASLSELARTIQNSGVTTLWLTASLFNLMVDHHASELRGTRCIIAGGEALSVAHMFQARELLPNTRLVNGYGPTENTTFTCTYHLDQDPTGWASIPIGKAISNTHTYVLDEAMEPVAPGVPGQLMIGGDGLAQGYLGDPAKTAALFVPDPYGSPGSRIYQSGDRVYLLPQDPEHIRFLGRRDAQLKVRGFRIEPGEIETRLREKVAQAVVKLWQGESGDKRLVAYVAGAQNETEHADVSAQLDRWQMLFDQTIYQDFDTFEEDPTLNLSGWHSSYDGSQIPEAEMRVWLDDTVCKIQQLKPRRTLEMGCGTGMLLFRVAPGGERYVGCDLSKVAIAHVQAHLARPELAGVDIQLDVRGAERFENLGSHFDLVLLNSVIQYFPSIDYLDEVVRGALDVLEPGGHLFLGDIRDGVLLRHLRTDIARQAATADTSIKALRTEIRDQVREEGELCIHPAYFYGLAERYEAVTHVEVLHKRGEVHNELTMFRYDVRVYTGAVNLRSASWQEWDAHAWTLEQVAQTLVDNPTEILALSHIPNRRLDRVARTVAILDDPVPPATVAELDALVGEPLGLDPQSFFELGDKLGMETRVYAAGLGRETRFDVAFFPKDQESLLVASPQPRTSNGPIAALANQPMKGTSVRKLVPQLRHHLSSHLPDYMVPAAFVVLDTIPLTTGGKIDWRALPEPQFQQTAAAEWVQTHRVTEDLVAGIWAQVLGVGHVGATDNFFDLGGHSLLATQVISAVRGLFALELPLRTFFENPTVTALAKAIDDLRRQDQGLETPPLQPRPANAMVPLSYAQQRLWFLFRLEPGNAFYNSPAALRLEGELHLDALQQALDFLVNRHESLRTRFPEVDGEPVQEILPATTVSLVLEDLSHLEPRIRQSQLGKRLSEEAQRAFDLDRQPPFRVRLYRQGARDHVLAINMHHIITDGWSFGILVREISATYSAFRQKRQPKLPELPVQYPDFALWQRGWLTGEALEKRLNYWVEKLRNPPVLNLQTDKVRPANLSFKGEEFQFQVPREVVQQLKFLAQSEGATLFMGLLAAFKILLYRFSGQADLVVGSPIANRNRAETEDLVGFFINMLALRTDLSSTDGQKPHFKQILQRVRETTLDAYLHQDVPFENIVDAVVVERDPSRNPVYQVVFGLLNTTTETLELDGLTISAPEVDSGSANFDITINAVEKADGLSVSWRYSTDLFHRASMEAMGRHFRNLLAAIVATPEQTMDRLQLMGEVERNRLLQEPNQRTALPYSVPLIHARFREMVETHGDALALVYEDARFTYAELGGVVNQWAHLLYRMGVGPDMLVGICLERGCAQIIGLLAIIQAGGAYLPLDPDYPEDRLGYMLADARPALLLTRESFLEKLHHHGAEVVLMDGEDKPNLPLPSTSEVLHVPMSPDNLGYVIYTSGSTGRPKGSMLHHRGWCNTIASDIDLFGLGPGFRVPHFVSLSFDPVASHVFMALCSGATLYVCPGQGAELSNRLAELMEREAITHAAFPTAILSALPQMELPHLQAVAVGGENCTQELVSRWGANRRFYNIYGHTETSIYATTGLVTPADRKPHVGGPIPNMRFHVLDPLLQPVPVGVGGELCAAGPGLGRGYLGRPALTAQKFVPNPFALEPGERLYRSGDLGRYLHRKDQGVGHLDFLGRIDKQVKLRGFRIELGEIEATLASFPQAKEAAVILRGVDPDKRLIGYVQPEAGEHGETWIDEVRTWLEARLPHYMVPAELVVLPQFPLTPNGKIDRDNLPDPEMSQAHEIVAPRTATETQLAQIWAQVLGHEQVSVVDNFFEIGGHSLLATRVVSQIRKLMGVELAVRQLFVHGTVAQLADHLDQHTTLHTEQAPITTSASGPAPLSFAQRRLWFFDRMELGSPVYNLPAALSLKGPLDISALQKALDQLVDRHDVLRTRFRQDGETTFQIVDVVPPPFKIVDLSYLNASRQEQEARAVVGRISLSPFSLTDGPLLRVVLLHLGAQQHVLVLCMHHIISDGWSMGVFSKEIAALYRASVREQASPLPSLEIQYADFSRWQHQQAREGIYERQLAYWQEHLAGAPPCLDLPTDAPRPAVQTTAGAHFPIKLDALATARVQALASDSGCTLFMVLQAAFSALLAHDSGHTDILVGSPVANRNRAEIEPLIGFFVNTLVLRSDFSADPSFYQLLARTKARTLDAFANQDVPFERVVAKLAPERNLGHHPLFQVMFALQNNPMEPVELPGLTMEPLAAERVNTQFDVSLNLSEVGDQIVGMFEYNSHLFQQRTIATMAQRFLLLLERVAGEPNVPLSRLNLVSAEMQTQLATYNDTEFHRESPQLLHQFVQEQALKTPDATALLCAGEAITYGEMMRHVNHLAACLQERGVICETPVAVSAQRGPLAVYGLLATLVAGGTYVPIDVGQPEARLRYMLENSGVSLILAEDVAHTSLLATGLPVLPLNQTPTEDRLRELAQPQSTAYILYTSGSTGLPKGVAVSHEAIANRIAWARNIWSLETDDRFLVIAASTFDIALWELLAPLCCGGAAVLPLPDQEHHPTQLLETLQTNAVTHAHFVPSLLRALLEHPNFGTLNQLRHIYCGGEAVPAQLAAQLAQTSEAALHQFYGPTEGAINATCWTRPLTWEEDVLPLGRPIDNATVHICNAQGTPRPIGLAGELFLGGLPLARGYVSQPALTAVSFLPDPQSEQPGARRYRTGDRAYWRYDGLLQFMGRSDHQVKLRGQRIEPGEIAAVLTGFSEIRQALVCVVEERLVAYLIGESLTDAHLAEKLGKQLPDYMVPAAYVWLAEFPLNANGKLDRAALPLPQHERSSDRVAPRSEVESQLLEIWAGVLGLDPVQVCVVSDNFFQLGGDSILSIQVIARAHALGLQLTPRQLFANQTIAQLAGVAVQIEDQQAQEQVTGTAPLTPIQSQFLISDQVNHSHFNMAFMFQVPSDLDLVKMEQCLQAVYAHHDGLRGRFEQVDSRINMAFAEDIPPLEVVDLSQLQKTVQQHTLTSHAAKAQSSLDITQGPLSRVIYYRLGDSALFFWIIHHLLVDAVSWRILAEDLETVWQHGAQALPPKTSSLKQWATRLADQGPQYFSEDFAVFQNRTCISPRFLMEPGSFGETRSHQFALDTTLSERLIQAGPRTNTKEILLAGLARTLRVPGHEHLLVDVEHHGREDLFEDVNLSRTVGWFTTITPLCLPTGGTQVQQLEGIKEAVRDSVHPMSYGVLGHLASAQTRSAMRAVPSSQILFNYLGQLDRGEHSEAGQLLQGIADESVEPAISQENSRQHVLEVTIVYVAGQMQITLTVPAALDTAVLTHWEEDLTHALESLCDAGASLPLMPLDFPLAQLSSEALDRFQEMAVVDIYPLSPMQEGMLFHTLYEQDSQAYFEQRNCRFQGALDEGAFHQAWVRVTQRHAILRTSFHWDQLAQPVQVVHEHIELPWQSYDWRHRHDWRGALAQFQRAERQRGFDLGKAPLMRCALFRIEDDSWQFVWSHHHLLLDGWSMPALFNEVFAYYHAHLEGRSLNLPAPPPFANYIQWLNEQDHEQAAQYWQKLLAGFKAPTPLVVDGTKMVVEEVRGCSEFGFVLSAEETRKLETFVRTQHITTNTLLQGAWALLLHRYSGDASVLFGHTVSGRPANLPGVEGMVGLFINTLPVRADIAPTTTVAELLHDLRVQSVQGDDYAYSPLSEIKNWSEMAATEALFHSIVIFENFPVNTTQANDGPRTLSFELNDAFTETGVPLSVVAGYSGGLSVRIMYQRVRFSHTVVERMVGHLRMLLLQLAEDAARPLAHLQLLSSEEQHFLKQWHETAAPYSEHLCMHQLFERAVGQAPKALAVVCDGRQLTYKDLETRANQLAHQLMAKGVRPQSRVGVCLSRSEHMVVAVLAILKAGGTYVPMERAWPVERIAYILGDTQTRVLLTEAAIAETLDLQETEALCLDQLRLDAFPQHRPGCALMPDHQAYIIFTSGSTGQPKGVILQHRPVINLIEWVNQSYAVGPKDRLLFLTSLCFDLSVYDIFGILAAGGTIHVGTDADVGDPERLVALLQEHPITFWDTAPAALQQLLPFLPIRGEGSTDLRLAFLSGDWIPLALPERMMAVYPNLQMVALGGATEATIWSNFHNIAQVDPTWVSIPYGQPIQNAQYHVLDARLNPLPTNVPGDLYIGGACLSFGYERRPGLTATRYLPDPYSSRSGGVLYRTGDRARFMESGELEFLGRLDNQVKIRGYRIEMGEIEAVLARFPGVDDAAVVIRSDGGAPTEGGTCRLLGYAASRDDQVTPALLREYLVQALPEYMVPSSVMVLSELPISSNGKVDRKKLPDSEVLDASASYLAPRTKRESTLAQIWEEVLGVDRVGIEDNYFELGGDSIISIQLISRARVKGLKLSPKQLFQHQTVAELAEHVREQECTQVAQGPAWGNDLPTPAHFPLAQLDEPHLQLILGDSPGNIEDIYGLTPMQEGMFFHTLYATRNEAYYEQHSWGLTQSFDPEIFAASWHNVVRRHPILRTGFFWGELEKPVQVVYREVPSPLQRLDWRQEASQEALLAEFLTENRERGFDMEKAPLLRLSLIQLAEDQWHFVMLYHHLLMDGWSRANVLAEVFAGYRARLTGEDLKLPPESKYRNHIAWLADQDHDEAETFWRTTLNGFDTPNDYIPALTQPVCRETQHRAFDFYLTEESTEALMATSRNHRVTPNSLVQGAWALLVGRYSGTQDIVFGSTVSGRPPEVEGIEHMVGLFINTLPVRVQLPSDKPLIPILQALQDQQAAQMPYSYTPLADIQRLSPIPTGQALFNSIVVFDNYPVDEAIGQPQKGPRIHYGSSFSQTNYAMTLVATPGKRLRMLMSYDPSRFEQHVIQQMSQHLTHLLDQIGRYPMRRISHFGLLGESELHQLQAWNQTDRPFPAGDCIQHGFQRQALEQPDALALICNGHTWTYKQLSEQVHRLAHYLRLQGVQPGTRVALRLARNEQLVISMLAVLAAGGTYIPLECRWPEKRVRFILEDAGAALLLTETNLALDTKLPVLYLDTLNLNQMPTEAPQVQNHPNDEAYIIFTSGSTGEPKGVMVQHRPVVNLIHWVNTTYNVGPSDKLLFVTSPSFDLSVYDVFGTLTAGATIYLATDIEVGNPEILAEVVQTEGITFWDSAPAALSQLLPFLPEEGKGSTDLRLVFQSGDWVPLSLQPTLKGIFPNVHVMALGGATEAAIWSNVHPIAKVPSHWKSIPYGVPIQNAQYYVLDGQLRPCPEGVAGDLYIGGQCLSIGYLNRATKTAQSYLPDPFAKQPDNRLYATGDRARMLPCGDLEFLGRLDHQVKIRGYRIETGEIEAALLAIESIAEALVIAADDPMGHKQLLAYVRPQQSNACPSEASINATLSEKLPDYMMPAAIIPLNQFPTTVNGKLDREALPRPDRRDAGQYEPPTNEREQILSDIWCTTLGLERVGIRDNFFELGGHSLLAVSLTARVRAQLGIQLPLAALLEAPTFAEYAKQLGSSSSDHSPLVMIESGDTTKPAFYCVHPVGGNVLCFAALAQAMDGRPFVGLQSPSLFSKQAPSSIDTMAAAYIQTLKTHQPQGPYHLGGWSLGGLIAYEMAQQLKSQGEAVASLVLIDSYLYTGAAKPKHTDDAALLAHFVHDLASLARDTQAPSAAELRMMEPTEAYEHATGFARSLDLLPEDEEHVTMLWHAFRTNLSAGYAYKPKPGGPPLHHIVAADSSASVEPGNAANGWEELASVKTYSLAGNHYSLLESKHIAYLAGTLGKILNDADEKGVSQ